jgi:hypothetical protein
MIAEVSPAHDLRRTNRFVVKILPASYCSLRITCDFHANVMILKDRVGGGYTSASEQAEMSNKIMSAFQDLNAPL